MSEINLSLTGFDENEIEKILQDGVMKTSFNRTGGNEDQEDIVEKYPVSVILSKDEMEKWKEFKKAAKKRNDKKMLLSLIGIA